MLYSSRILLIKGERQGRWKGKENPVAKGDWRLTRQEEKRIDKTKDSGWKTEKNQRKVHK